MPNASEDKRKNPAPSLVDELNALPPGTRFGELEVLRTLGVSGFGTVYLARDHALEREIAIKEYMPGPLAQRGEGSMVSVRSGSLLETFEIGRR
jgi:serine/threonine protein kinase